MLGKLNKNLHLTLQRDGEDEIPSEGVLFGAIEGKSLIAGNFTGSDFQVGEELMVRIAAEGTIYWFWSTIMKKVEFDGTTYFLSYPRQMESLDQRTVPRMQVFIPVNAMLSSDGEERGFELHGALTDVSGDGCCLQSSVQLPENSTCLLSFSLPGTEDVFILEGQVVRLSQSEAFSRYGMKFKDSSRDQSSLGKLREWVDKNAALSA